MFKKSTMSLALTAAIVGVGALSLGTTSTVSAANQSSMTDATGDVLLYPFYTIDNGFRTLVHLVNTSKTDTTIVKVRLRDHKKSDDVLDFTVILSPNDVFAGTVRDNGNGTVSFVKANDTTCTSPNVGSFVPSFPISNGGSGHIEVITMATLDHDLATGRAGGTLDYPILNEIVTRTTHDSAGNNTKTDCDKADIYFAKIGSGGKNIAALQTELGKYMTDNVDERIRSNLYGHYTVVDFANGIQGGGRPSTLNGVLSTPVTFNAGTAGLKSACGGPDGTIICGQFPEHFEFPLLANVPGLDPTTSTVGSAANNVKAFNAVYGPGSNAANTNLVTDNISNEWTKNSSGTSTVQSEWVVTLPTKYIYRDDYPADVTGKTSKDTFTGVGLGATETNFYNDTANALFLASETKNIFDTNGCADYNYFRFDREEQTDVPSSGTSTSGGQADAPNAERFCNEVATLTFGDFDGVTHDRNASVVFGINTTSLNQLMGWGGFGLNGVSTADNSSKKAKLPMIGYAMWNRSFGTASGNFGHIMDHVKIGQ